MSTEAVWGALLAAIGALSAAVGLLFRELRKSDAKRVEFAEAQLAKEAARNAKLDDMLTKLLALAEAQRARGGFR